MPQLGGEEEGAGEEDCEEEEEADEEDCEEEEEVARKEGNEGWRDCVGDHLGRGSMVGMAKMAS